MKGWEANRALYLDKGGKVVEDGDPDAAFLRARKVRVIPEAQREQYGVRKKPPAEVDSPPAQGAQKGPDGGARNRGSKGLPRGVH